MLSDMESQYYQDVDKMVVLEKLVEREMWETHQKWNPK